MGCDTDQAQTQSSIGPRFLLFLLFMTLKLTNVIDWSWWWVTGPLWIPVSALLVIGLLIYLLSIRWSPK